MFPLNVYRAAINTSCRYAAITRLLRGYYCGTSIANLFDAFTGPSGEPLHLIEHYGDPRSVPADHQHAQQTQPRRHHAVDHYSQRVGRHATR